MPASLVGCVLRVFLGFGVPAATGDPSAPIVVDCVARPVLGDGPVCVEGVVLFEPGRVRSSEGYVLRADRGRGVAVPTELEATGAYPDGSLRAARVLACVPATIARAGAVFHLVRGRSPAPSAPVRATSTARGAVLDTADGSLEFCAEDVDLIRRITVRGVDRRAAERPVRIVTSTSLGDASSERAPSRSVVVERPGPLRARVKVSGFALDAADEAVLAWTLRVEARAGRGPLRFELDVVGTADVGIADDLTFELPLKSLGVVRARVFGADLAGPVERGVARVASDDGRHVDAT
ncbi:MAG: hypothetical protein JNL94_03520, partial [Planctomycetes bacterium]|nr:hypothetical protein [Planctomycetota bacterium]